MTVPPGTIARHAPDCQWEQADCDWKATHRYCPHPEHLCNCNYPARKRFSERKGERAAYEYGFKEGAAAERDRIRRAAEGRKRQMVRPAVDNGPTEALEFVLWRDLADLLDGAP